MAQQVPGKRDSIHSEILKEKRYFQVVLPIGYDAASKKKYDVIYVLDGDWNTKLLSDVEQLLGEEGRIPHNIIVSIFNTDRNRDFLPTHNQSNQTSGGADQFLNFLKKELIPYINKTYPSDGENTLFGHSFGGLFVTYALLAEPQLFNSYIAADPSYWWDNNVILKMVPPKLTTLKVSDRMLYVTGREGSGMNDMRIPQMDSILKTYAPATLTWKLVAYPDESHGTVRLKSAYDGLKFSYPNYHKGGIVFHPMNGMLLKNKPISLWELSDTTNVRYTTDGTEPTRSSAQFKKENILTGPAKVIIRRMTQRPSSDESFSGNFVTSDYLPPGKLDRFMKPGGFNYAYYEGSWSKLPDFTILKPVKTGRIDTSFGLDKLPRQINFGLAIWGQLKIQEDGYYLFAIDADDGFKFYLENRLLIDYDGQHGGEALGASYIVPLKKGFYHIRQEYFQKEGGRKLDFEYVSPGAFASKHSTGIPLALQYGITN
ncbi:alpha/beta hydrolase-fold protein [Spirosoma endbachense]|nr:alpha/beta hydrolase-fold protein [Spirosoma endbachense]